MSLLLSRARRVVAASSPLAAAAAPVQRVGARAFATLFAEEDKAFHVWNLLEAKRKSKLTFTEIAERTGLTNAYVAQLFYRQAQLKKDTVAKLKAAVPALSKDDLEVMQEIPFRSYHRDIIRTEPLIYRLEEAMLHYGQGIKAIVNENFGDGIMSAIDVLVSVDKTKGPHGEDRVLITLNGKFLPHVEQSVTGATATKVTKSAAAAASSSSSSGGGLVKRSRGRPTKKNNTVGLMSSLSTLSTPPPSATEAAEQQKRGRGRPRKQPALPSLAASLSTTAGAGAAKRPAGRPRKQQQAEQEEKEMVLQAAPTKIVVQGEGEQKRGRGRPKGSKSSYKPAAAQIWV